MEHTVRIMAKSSVYMFHVIKSHHKQSAPHITIIAHGMQVIWNVDTNTRVVLDYHQHNVVLIPNAMESPNVR